MSTAVVSMGPVPASQPISLADLATGQQGRVVEVTEPGALGERLLEMGLTPGTVVTLVRRGWLGDPVQLSLRGYMLSLRRAQAGCIRIERLG